MINLEKFLYRINDETKEFLANDFSFCFVFPIFRPLAEYILTKQVVKEEKERGKPKKKSKAGK